MAVGPRLAGGTRAAERTMFFFFSNRLGCLGSIAVSLVITLVLLAVLGII